MTRHEQDPLARWRAAEAAYADAAAPYVCHGEVPLMTKEDLIGLVALRCEADRSRERYFKRCHEDVSESA